jgi:hypothetical protein
MRVLVREKVFIKPPSLLDLEKETIGRLKLRVWKRVEKARLDIV